MPVAERFRLEIHTWLEQQRKRTRGCTAMPVGLTDAQLVDVLTVAETIPYPLRAAFLRALAAELGDRDGDGEVHRAALRARQTVLPKLQAVAGWS
jgi:hypothetical protein